MTSEDLDKLATKPPPKVKPYKENFIEEKPYKAKIAESEKSSKDRSAVITIIIVSIYGATIIFCLVIIGFFGLATAEKKELITLVITSQAILIGSAIGFYFGKN